MGSKINARCPKCGDFGYFYVENRKNTRISIRSKWFQIKKKHPSFSDKKIKAEIMKFGKIIRNIPRKEEYNSEFRGKRKPLFYVVHNIKKDGKWKTRKCYLGIYPTAMSMLDDSIRSCKRNHRKLEDMCECGAIRHHGLMYQLDLGTLIKSS